MSRTPRAWAPSSSASRAIRLRSRVVRCTTHSSPSSRWMPNATASAPIRTRAIAESEMFTQSAPASRRRRAESMVRSMRIDRGGSISTETTYRPVRSFSRRDVGGGASPAVRSGAPLRIEETAGTAAAGAEAATVARPPLAGPPVVALAVPGAPAAPAAPATPAAGAVAEGTAPTARSSAIRMAATCSGVVPQQPPMIRAPAASASGTISANQSGPAANTKRPSTRWDRPAFGITLPGSRATPATRTSASRLPTGPVPQFTPTASTPAAASAAAAASGLVPSASAHSSPNVSDATTGRPAAARASASASRSGSSSLNVSRMRRSTPPSRRPSICSRKTPRAVRPAPSPVVGRPGRSNGPTEPATRASRPVTSRASRASCAARRLIREAMASNPHAARRIRLAPNVAVSIRSAPASRYSRWIVATRSARVRTSSSRQARWGIPREKSSVPIAPSARIGPAARRAANRARAADGAADCAADCRRSRRTARPLARDCPAARVRQASPLPGVSARAFATCR